MFQRKNLLDPTDADKTGTIQWWQVAGGRWQMANRQVATLKPLMPCRAALNGELLYGKAAPPRVAEQWCYFHTKGDVLVDYSMQPMASTVAPSMSLQRSPAAAASSRPHITRQSWHSKRVASCNSHAITEVTAWRSQGQCTMFLPFTEVTAMQLRVMRQLCA
jgi:hypothetical protein